MVHYIVIHDWAREGSLIDCGVDIIGVAHSLEEAKNIFAEVVIDEKEVAMEGGYEIYEDNDTMFDAGENGYYAVNHTRLYIQMIGR